MTPHQGATTCRECSTAVPRLECSATAQERHLALPQVQELILGAVPMPLTEPRARRKSQQIDTELRHPGTLAQPPALADQARLVMRRGIAAADHRRRELGQVRSSSWDSPKRRRLRKARHTPRPVVCRRRQPPAGRIRTSATPSGGGTAAATTRTGIDLAAGVPLSRS